MRLGSHVVDAKYKIREVGMSESRSTVELGSQISLPSPENTSLSSSGPVALLLCLCMCVCMHALEIDTPVGPEAPEQALTAPGLWSLE